MDILANLAVGFGVALSPFTLFLAVCGCFLGTIIGALPGLGPSNGVAILIPIIGKKIPRSPWLHPMNLGIHGIERKIALTCKLRPFLVKETDPG